MSIDQLETTNDYNQFCRELVKEIQSITTPRAATWTNYMRVFSHSGVAETGFKRKHKCDEGMRRQWTWLCII